MKTARMMFLGALGSVLAAAPAYASGGMGMTWAKTSHTATFGVDLVGCSNCSASVGDTACTTSLPILCIKKDNSPTPSGLATDFYHGWAGGVIASTFPIPGTALLNLTVANQMCVANFGAGWRMAEFHDGNGGWSWYAHGDVRSDMRHWVYINDQPANCWNP